MVLLERAGQLLSIGRSREAESLVRQALAASPDCSHGHGLLAQCGLVQGRPGEALNAAQRAISLAPEDEWGHRLRALACLGLRRNKDALRAACEVARLAPDLPEARYVLGVAQLENGAAGEARRLAEDLLHQDPESTLGPELLAAVAVRGERWNEVEACVRRALEIEPEAWRLHNTLGVALDRLGRRREAIDAFHAAARLAPSEPEVQSNLVRIVARYAAFGAGFFLFFVSIQVVFYVARHDVWLGVALIALALLLVWSLAQLWQRWKLRRIHPSIAAFFRERKRRG